MPAAVAVPAESVTARGVAASDSSDVSPGPEALRARTLNLYAEPSVSSVTVYDRVFNVLVMSLQSSS